MRILFRNAACTLTIGIGISLLTVPALAQTSTGGVLTSANCLLWIDAGDINGDGDYTNNPAVNTDISTWNDKSGNANNLTQGTAASRPNYNTLAGTSVVRFDNTGTNADYMTATNQSMLTAGTMYFVLRMLDAGDAANCLFDRSGNGNSSVRFAQYNTLNVLGFTKYGTSDYASTISSVYGSNVILSYLKTSASDNLDIALNSSSVNLTVGSANPGLPLYVLGKNSTVDGMNGYVMEALCYNTNLNYAQKMIIDNYLSAKYNGIAIISDKYAGDTGGNGNYDFELGGVGNESGTNNSAASSITGGLGASQNVAMGAGEYLMYAHQSTPVNSVNVTDVGGMSAGAAKGRWERIWYLDWTHVGGSNETVDLVFDYSDGGMGGNPAGATSNYKLLYRAGTSGNWTEVMNASSIAGDRVTFTGLAWNTQGDGYYTIGSLNTGVSPLPIEVTGFYAEACAQNICVTWNVTSEFGIQNYVVDRSADGNNWSELAKLKAVGARIYHVTDSTAPEGIVYYRLRSLNDTGSAVSSLVIAYNNAHSPGTLLYPNPATAEFTIEFDRRILTLPEVSLTDLSGKVMALTVLEWTANKARIDIREVNAGVYIVDVIVPEGIRFRRKLVVR